MRRRRRRRAAAQSHRRQQGVGCDNRHSPRTARNSRTWRWTGLASRRIDFIWCCSICKSGVKRPLDAKLGSLDQQLCLVVETARRCSPPPIIWASARCGRSMLPAAARRPSPARAKSKASASAPSKVFYTASSLGAPADLYSVGFSGGKPAQLTRVNEALHRRSANSPSTSNSVFPAGTMKMCSATWSSRWISSRTASIRVAFLIHGGPQGSFGNAWSCRWNPQVFAGAGYAVVMIDFHGSTGYGQAFTDSISGDWGGKPLDDLKLGLSAALKANPWLDADRVCALGGSYGGFMINWIAGSVARSLQVPGQPRRHFRQSHHVLLHRGTVVSGTRVFRSRVPEPGGLRQVQSHRLWSPNGRPRRW